MPSPSIVATVGRDISSKIVISPSLVKRRSSRGSVDFERMRDIHAACAGRDGGDTTIREVPKGQRFLNRPELDKIFKRGGLRDKGWGNQKLEEAGDRFGHTQREIAELLNATNTPDRRRLFTADQPPIEPTDHPTTNSGRSPYFPLAAT